MRHLLHAELITMKLKLDTDYKRDEAISKYCPVLYLSIPAKWGGPPLAYGPIRPVAPVPGGSSHNRVLPTPRAPAGASPNIVLHGGASWDVTRHAIPDTVTKTMPTPDPRERERKKGGN